MCRDDSVLEERRKMLVTWGFVRCLHNAVVTAIGHNCNCGCSCHVTTVSPSPVSHELNMISFVRLSVRLSHQLYTLKPITSTSEMTWHLECGETLKLIEIVKKNYRSLANGPQKYGRKRPRDTWCWYASVAHLLYSASELQLCDLRKCGIFRLQNAAKR